MRSWEALYKRRRLKDRKAHKDDVFFSVSILRQETNVRNSYLTRMLTCEISFRSSIWNWTRKENSTWIKLGSKNHSGTGSNCWDKGLMDLFVRSTRRMAVATRSFSHCLFKTSFSDLHCYCFVMHSFTISPGGLWLSLITFLGCQLHQQF